MKELDAAMEWNRLPYAYRIGLVSGLPPALTILGHSGVGKTWAEQAPEVQRALLKLDWNFMLGGKLGKR